MSGIFDLTTDALALIFSDEKGLNYRFRDIGLNFNESNRLNRAKFVYEETLKMNRSLKSAK